MLKKKKQYVVIEGQMSLFPGDDEYSDDETKEDDGVLNEKKSSEVYWEACDAMLTSWGPYVGRQDLLDNINDDQTRHRVWHVLQNSFHGSLYALESRVKQLKSEFIVDYNAYVKKCSEYGVEAVSLKWLRSNLWNGDDLKSYRSRCRTCKGKPEKYPPKSLKDFPPRKVKGGK